MDKKLTYTLIVGILIISFSAAYYFIAFLPAKEKNRLAQEANEKQAKSVQQDLENNIKCREAGEKAYKADIAEIGMEGNYYIPVFIFNKSLNTCLYKGGYTNFNGYTENFIKDVYSNKNIYLWGRILQDDTKYKDLLGNSAEFSKKDTELFGN